MKLNEWNAKDAFGSAGGLLTCWDPTKVEGHLLNQNRYSITIKFTCKNLDFMWILTNAYGPHEQVERRKFFTEVTQLRQVHQEPWVLMGDFNAVRFTEDRRGKGNNASASKLFNKFVNHNLLLELGLNIRHFTWSNLREDAMLAKLDRYIVSLDWHHQYPLTMLSTLVRSTLDHTPLILHQTRGSWGMPPSNRPFCFENLWFSCLGFGEWINSWWESAPKA